MEALKRIFGILSLLLITGSTLAQSSPPISTHVTAVPFRDLLLVIDLKNTLDATVVIPNCAKTEGQALCRGYFRLEEKTERGWETRLERFQPGAGEPLREKWRPYTLANNKYGADFSYEMPEVLRYGIKPGSLVRVVVYAYDPIYASTFPSDVGSLVSKPHMEIVSAPFVVPTWE